MDVQIDTISTLTVLPSMEVMKWSADMSPNEIIDLSLMSDIILEAEANFIPTMVELMDCLYVIHKIIKDIKVFCEGGIVERSPQ